MPVHIQKMTSDVTAVEGELPLSQKQIEMLVNVILERLETVDRETKIDIEATTIRSQAAPPD